MQLSPNRLSVVLETKKRIIRSQLRKHNPQICKMKEARLCLTKVVWNLQLDAVDKSLFVIERLNSFRKYIVSFWKRYWRKSNLHFQPFPTSEGLFNPTPPGASPAAFASFLSRFFLFFAWLRSSIFRRTRSTSSSATFFTASRSASRFFWSSWITSTVLCFA